MKVHALGKSVYFLILNGASAMPEIPIVSFRKHLLRRISMKKWAASLAENARHLSRDLFQPEWPRNRLKHFMLPTLSPSPMTEIKKLSSADTVKFKRPLPFERGN